jgi:hypothetical protein
MHDERHKSCPRKRPSAVAVQCTKCNASLHIQIKETRCELDGVEESRPFAGGWVKMQRDEGARCPF